jgi:hypothetical protein
VSVAAVLGLVGALLSLVDLFGNPASSIISSTTSGSTTSISLNFAALDFLAALGGVGFILGIVVLWYFLRTFRTLAPGDEEFKTPATLALLAIIAVVLAAVLTVALLAVLVQAITCAGNGNAISVSCINVNALLALAVLVLILAIVAIAGAIGILLGIWRLGTRYDQSGFRIGAILLIFPFLNIVGYILILLAARTARRRFGSLASDFGFGSGF